MNFEFSRLEGPNLAVRVDITMISDRPLCSGSTDDYVSRQNYLGCPVKKRCSELLKSSF